MSDVLGNDNNDDFFEDPVMGEEELAEILGGALEDVVRFPVQKTMSNHNTGVTVLGDAGVSVFSRKPSTGGGAGLGPRPSGDGKSPIPSSRNVRVLRPIKISYIRLDGTKKSLPVNVSGTSVSEVIVYLGKEALKASGIVHTFGFSAGKGTIEIVRVIGGTQVLDNIFSITINGGEYVLDNNTVIPKPTVQKGVGAPAPGGAKVTSKSKYFQKISVPPLAKMPQHKVKKAITNASKTAARAMKRAEAAKKRAIAYKPKITLKPGSSAVLGISGAIDEILGAVPTPANRLKASALKAKVKASQEKYNAAIRKVTNAVVDVKKKADKATGAAGKVATTINSYKGKTFGGKTTVVGGLYPNPMDPEEILGSFPNPMDPEEILGGLYPNPMNPEEILGNLVYADPIHAEEILGEFLGVDASGNCPDAPNYDPNTETGEDPFGCGTGDGAGTGAGTSAGETGSGAPDPVVADAEAEKQQKIVDDALALELEDTRTPWSEPPPDAVMAPKDMAWPRYSKGSALFFKKSDEHGPKYNPVGGPQRPDLPAGKAGLFGMVWGFDRMSFASSKEPRWIESRGDKRSDGLNMTDLTLDALFNPFGGIKKGMEQLTNEANWSDGWATDAEASAFSRSKSLDTKEGSVNYGPLIGNPEMPEFAGLRYAQSTGEWFWPFSLAPAYMKAPILAAQKKIRDDAAAAAKAEKDLLISENEKEKLRQQQEWAAAELANAIKMANAEADLVVSDANQLKVDQETAAEHQRLDVREREVELERLKQQDQLDAAAQQQATQEGVSQYQPQGDEGYFDDVMPSGGGYEGGSANRDDSEYFNDGPVEEEDSNAVEDAPYEGESEGDSL